MTHLRTALVTAALAAASPLAAQDATAPTARAVLIDANGAAIGTAEFIGTPAGVLITATLEGLPRGILGFHIHETGVCEPPFTSAGGHFNPTGKEHGFLAAAGPHPGDMPNIHVPESGKIEIEVLNTFIDLEDGALLDADGAALLVHAHADDYRSQPSGEAGDRIACGVIAAD